ncbi:hypothetical protein ACFPFV_07815 [Salinicoccus siamensis]|uniref:hypothetical protein n=1 Tax=Salinicoccus siamensis TaxID=381830 RepID=UPI003615FFB2
MVLTIEQRASHYIKNNASIGHCAAYLFTLSYILITIGNQTGCNGRIGVIYEKSRSHHQ